MFIHTVLTEHELRATMPRTGLDDVRLHILGTSRSRSHPNRFEVALRGVGARHTRAPQTHILDRSERERAATYDDWGWWLAEVFEMDETARCGNYRGRQEFEQVTRYLYIAS